MIAAIRLRERALELDEVGDRPADGLRGARMVIAGAVLKGIDGTVAGVPHRACGVVSVEVEVEVEALFGFKRLVAVLVDGNRRLAKLGIRTSGEPDVVRRDQR